MREGSVGRRFHFVSLAACGGAIAAALCQSVTLSRHPFYHLARGCPAPLSIRSTPPHPLLTAPPTSHGYNAGSRQGLPDCLPYLSLSPLSPSLYLLPAISLLVPFPAKWKATPRPPYDPVEGSRRREESHDKIVKRVETFFSPILKPVLSRNSPNLTVRFLAERQFGRIRRLRGKVGSGRATITQLSLPTIKVIKGLRGGGTK